MASRRRKTLKKMERICEDGTGMNVYSMKRRKRKVNRCFIGNSVLFYTASV